MSDLNKILSLVLLAATVLYAQLGWEDGDMVTYSDSRNALCAELGDRVIYIATNGGIWRYSKFDGEPLDPVYYGLGRSTAIDLTIARTLLWHKGTGSLWVAGTRGLKFYRSTTQKWYDVPQFDYERIVALGETDDSVIAEVHGKDFLEVINPMTGGSTITEDSLEVRWAVQGELDVRFKHLDTGDSDFIFYPNGGIIEDQNFVEYRPFSVAQSDWNDELYLCYPGLGVAIVDQRMFRLDIQQLGPSGSDIKAIALDEFGNVWMGGDNSRDEQGISVFVRKTGRWKQFRARDLLGMDTQIVHDAVVVDDKVYFATDNGLLMFDIMKDFWRTFDRFKGLNLSDLRTISKIDNRLFLAGDNGACFFDLPTGPFETVGNDVIDGLNVAGSCSDSDTLWIAGIAGIQKYMGGDAWSNEKMDPVIGKRPSRSVKVMGDYISFANDGGIADLNRVTGQWRSFYYDQQLEGGLPLSLSGNDSLLFVGTDKGLFRYNRNKGDWKKFTDREGLPHQRVQCLVLEADTLWIGTPKGLTRFMWNDPVRDG